ncbi:MAG: 16S rRNA (cytidine(1402)-2'-O)-methyltransferase [Patescibacteria group bacterium]|nr:16S rRNA (cytidine(1402)-2'-O)-methyltransferase [Patescibacteria group bacterium]
MLYIVATPIGNLQDISQRALDTLQGVDFILCEDTRLSGKLLSRFNIKKPLISYHQHSHLQKTDYILDLLAQGKNLALVSDAGTPGISDPGNKLVEEAVKLALIEVEGSSGRAAIAPIPGPSAITAIASVAGFAMDRFLFLGFPPIKKKRRQFFEEILDSKYPVIFYESCHRILRTLNDLLVISSSRNIGISLVVGRELTKKFETIYRGSAGEVIEQIKKDAPTGRPKGEFVVTVSRP